ncbi:MAG: hypothetical protein IJK40_07165 [Clostridia bacterium]|nr:hypothetical protein [Clostridia bacterium]MBR0537912.1 hypothetical protein [Clostridia bacterium]
MKYTGDTKQLQKIIDGIIDFLEELFQRIMEAMPSLKFKFEKAAEEAAEEEE